MANNDEDRFVVPTSNGGWGAVKEAHERASGHLDTQEESIARAREFLTKTSRGLGEVRILGEDGWFRDSDAEARIETDAKGTH